MISLEDDKGDDVLETTNPSVTIDVGEVDEAFKDKLASLTSEFGDVLCEEPGLTEVVELEIDTGSSPPGYQSAYNTPVSVREKVTEEIEWLKKRGYIRESQSPWALPIVTVRKPSGAMRLCVDYKRFNAIMGPAPFYMPMVEDTIEAVAETEIISTIDLNKRYYQVWFVRKISQKQPLSVEMDILSS